MSNDRAISRDFCNKHCQKAKIDQVPTASLDANGALDDDESELESDEDDTSALIAELQRIKKERAAEPAKKVKFLHVICILRIN